MHFLNFSLAVHSNLQKNVGLLSARTFFQIRFVHHHKEIEEPGGFERFIGWRRSNTAKANRNTHVNERKFKKLRGAKRLIIELEEDIDQKRELDKMGSDQLRMYNLRKGKPNIFKDIAPREWNEHQITLNSFGQTVDPYIPPETSWFSRAINEPVELLDDFKSSTKRAFYNIFYGGTRRIKKKEGFENFDVKAFPKIAEQVYIDAYIALVNRDKQRLHELVTERMFAMLWPDVERGTLRWKLLNFNEPSRVISVQCTDMPQKSGNDIAQITVRLNSTQMMALYDKDGHLLLGSEQEPKESIVEYIVFENHVASIDGLWRLHDRIYPDWLKPKQPILRKKIVEDQNEADKEKIPKKPLKLRTGVTNKMRELEDSEA